VAAMTAGRARWVERLRKAKAMGLIERFPGGRRPKGPRPSSKGKAVEQTRAPMVDGRATLPPALPRPALVTSEEAGLPVPAEETLGPKLNRITGKSLDLERFPAG
jgi:hypothetical protein